MIHFCVILQAYANSFTELHIIHKQCISASSLFCLVKLTRTISNLQSHLTDIIFSPRENKCYVLFFIFFNVFETFQRLLLASLKAIVHIFSTGQIFVINKKSDSQSNGFDLSHMDAVFCTSPLIIISWLLMILKNASIRSNSFFVRKVQILQRV